ncbi:MAG: regulatory protein RecX [Jatrophihabitantaceae bacterium]
MSVFVPPDDQVSLGPPADPESVARTICLRLLDRRARTRGELASALRRKGVPDEAAERVLDRFTEVGLIDDRALANGYALAQHRERGLAGRAVAKKLRHRGVDEDTVRTAVEQIDPDSERDAACALASKRLTQLSGLEPLAQARRLVGLLARRGYAPAMAHDVVRTLLAEVELAEP